MERLTSKQRKFVNAFVETEGNGTQSALQAYDTTDTNVAAAIASENLNKPKIINALEEALPDELLAKIHLEGLFATKPIYDATGGLIAEDADFNARHKYLDSAYKIKGRYAAEKHVNFNVEVEPTDELKEAAKILNDYYRHNNGAGASSTSDGAISSDVGVETQDTK